MADGSGRNFTIPPITYIMRIGNRYHFIQSRSPHISIAITVILGEIEIGISPSKCIVMLDVASLELTGKIEHIAGDTMVGIKTKRKSATY